MTFMGWVHVREAPDQRTTVVTVVVGATQTSPLDVVTVAFRLQHGPRALVDYAGPATVLYTRTRLTVAVTDRVGWTFVVPRSGGIAETDDSGYPQAGLTGLSFFWGALVHDREDMVFERLVLGSCGAGGGDSCADCQSGGPGATECSASCGDGDCQATCGGGHSACCKCPMSCACCPNIGG
jgi:hypothetical protein